MINFSLITQFFNKVPIHQGQKAEKAACIYLKKHGLKLIQANFSAPFGEIDLIMQEKDTLVFIEVRYRKNNHYGGAIASVNLKKQKKIIKTAQLFLIQYPQYQKKPKRFDIVGITPKEEKQDFIWIKNAFLVS